MTSPFDSEQVSLALEALTRDAGKWTEHADVMAGAAREAASYSLTGFHIGYIPNQQGFGRMYAELQELLVRLLTEGETAMRDMGRALLTARDNYEQAERDSADRLLGAEQRFGSVEPDPDDQPIGPAGSRMSRMADFLRERGLN
ncbi:MAG TPA: hypothetical protein VFX61_09535 [Micromonosporaceae bacterium]|nr:hypothetical protein [Micromonosporaceae bacterium]